MDRVFIKIPLCKQETSYTCGPAALQCVLAYYGVELRQDNLEKELHTVNEVGTDFRKMLRFSNLINFSAFFIEEMQINVLEEYIDNNIPIILLLQAWKNNSESYWDTWGDNHYVVACGYDVHNVYFMDPSTLGYYTYLPKYDLLSRWHFKDAYGQYNKSALIIRDNYNYTPYDSTLVKYLG